MEKKKLLVWFKKIGWAGFLFFFLKGMVWITIGMGVVKCNS
jgi:hypothetical protein